MADMCYAPPGCYAGNDQSLNDVSWCLSSFAVAATSSFSSSSCTTISRSRDIESLARSCRSRLRICLATKESRERIVLFLLFFFFNKFARVFDSSVISCGCFISTTRDSRVVSAQIPDDSPVETEFKDLDFYSLCTRLSLSLSFLLSTLLSLLSTTRADLLSSTTRVDRRLSKLSILNRCVFISRSAWKSVVLRVFGELC